MTKCIAASLHDLPTHSHRLQFFVTLRHSVRYGNTLCTDAETIRSVFYVDTCSQKLELTRLLFRCLINTLLPIIINTSNKIVLCFAKKKKKNTNRKWLKMVYMYIYICCILHNGKVVPFKRKSKLR